MLGGVRPQVPDQKSPGEAEVLGRLCPGAGCEITGVRRECWGQRSTGNRAGLEGRWGWGDGESREGKARQSPPLESRLWTLLSGGAGVGRELEAGLRAMWGGEKVTVGGSGVHRQEEGV